MKRLKILVFLAIVVATCPLRLEAQTLEFYSFLTNRVLPDGNASGMSEVRQVNSAIGAISSVKVRLSVAGEFNGDLYGFLSHSNGFTVLLNRPGKTLSNTSGYPDSGLDLTFQQDASNGDIHVYRNASSPADGLPLTGTWQPDGRNTDPAFVTDASPRGTSLTNFNGLSANGEWTLFLADMDSGGTNMLTGWELEIAGAAAPTIAWVNPADIVYGTALTSSQFNATVTYGSTNVPGTLTYTPEPGTILNAGSGQTLSVTFIPSDTNAFLPVTTSVAINVTPAPLTITALDTSKLYGQAMPTFTASYSGFVNGDDAAVLDVPVHLSTTATAVSDVGTYAITANGASDSNYSIHHVNGTLTVNQASSSGAIVSSSNPALPGANVTFTHIVSAIPPGAGTPTGIVYFRIDGTVAGSASLSEGTAEFTISNLAVGTHVVVAEFPGSGNFIGVTNALSPAQTINTPPVAGNDSLERYMHGDVKVRLATLLENDLDADGDPLIPTLNPASASGGTVSLIGSWVFYQPAPGFTNADSFTYTIVDGRGGSHTATVSVAIKTDTSPTLNLRIVDLGGGTLRIDGWGIPGRTYRLQYTPTLSPPNWIDLADGEVTAGINGAFTHTDSPGTSRFYRTVSP